MMIVKQIIGRELYVYMNGTLLYKRWLDLGYGIMLPNKKCGLCQAQGAYTSNDVKNQRQ